ncbi:MAG TPA: hypothetical protein VJO53_09615 [Candidatus Acidoferrales bacterium]|nr:hypothetical protein [Candidatus Acidoferrales bacterium]
MSEYDPFGGNEALRRIITRFWTTPERAEWTPKTDVILLPDLREWMASSDIEIVGFAHSMMSDARFRIEPALTLEEYVEFVKTYYERCLRDSPDGEWSDSRYSAGWDLVSIFGSLWRDPQASRSLLDDLKSTLARLYREGDGSIRTCIVQATLEHLVEQKPIRQFFSDWENDPVLCVAFKEACLWPDGGGNTPLG